MSRLGSRCQDEQRCLIGGALTVLTPLHEKRLGVGLRGWLVVMEYLQEQEIICLQNSCAGSAKKAPP